MGGCRGWMVVDEGAKIEKVHGERLRSDLEGKGTNASQRRVLFARHGGWQGKIVVVT